MTAADVVEHFIPWAKQVRDPMYQVHIERTSVDIHLMEKHRWFNREGASSSELLAIHRELHLMEPPESAKQEER